MNLGDRIRYERKQMGLTVAQLAARAGIDAGALGRIETGTTRRPQRGTLLRLAEALDLTPEALGVKADGQTCGREGYRPRFAYCRMATGHSQGEVARRLNIRPKTLEAYETCQAYPPAWLIVKMVELYGVSADYLLGCPPDKYSGRYCMIGFCEAGLVHDHCCADCEHRDGCGDACQNLPGQCGYCRTKRPHEMLARKEAG